MIAGRKNLSIFSGSEEQTVAFGKELASLLKNGDVVSLTGPLGAGKTCLIRGIALGLGIDNDDIKSPSFTLVNEYYGALPLFHIDLYRVKEPSEFYEIGLDDYLMRDGVVAVEWGEKAEGALPKNRIQINIGIVSEFGRNLKINFVE